MKHSYYEILIGLVKGKFVPLVACMISALIFSCGEDRTYEYDEMTMPTHYAEEVMMENYLWGDSLKPLEWKDYFASPSAFMDKITKQSPDGDKWSYIDVDTLSVDHFERGKFNHFDSYGLDYVLMTDPTGETTKQYARILTVYPHSPAAECGIERGSFISLIDGEKVTSKNIDRLKQGRERKLTVSLLGFNENDGSIYWASTDTLIMGKSRKVTEGQIWNSYLIDRNTAYIMLLNLNDEDAVDALQTLLTTNPQTVIVDLRLCNQGSIDKVMEIASLLSDKSGVLLKTSYNSRRSGENKIYEITKPHYSNEIVFVTSNYTQGAAEWLIHGLKGLSDKGRISVFGTSSAGQNVLLEEIQSPYSYTINYAAAYITDGEGNAVSSIVPDVTINEYEYIKLYPYGNRFEAVLDSILNRQ